MAAIGRRFTGLWPRFARRGGTAATGSTRRGSPPAAGVAQAQGGTSASFPNRPPTLVLVCRAIVHDVGAPQDAARCVKGVSDDLGGPAWTVARRELAIVIESDVTAAVVAVAAVKRRWPHVRVLVVGLSNREDAVLRCADAGADGVVSRDESADQLIEAAREILMGAFRRPQRPARPLFDRLVRVGPEGCSGHGRPWVTRFSTREIQVLECLARGSSNKDIAGELHVELQTVKNHIGHILRKLGVHSRFDAVRVAPVASEVS
jgi:DNA-binding NarL/FixJ family response regulator